MKLNKGLFFRRHLPQFAILGLLASSFSQAAGGIQGGGGDIHCDAKIKKIALNIENWIDAGGPQEGQLNLSMTSNPSTKKPYTINEYAEAMNRFLHSNLSSGCVVPGDAGYPVSVEDKSKICRTRFEHGQVDMTCDQKKLLDLSADEIIEQIHHEYAILVPGLEPVDGPVSTYRVSTQLSAYTSDVTERQLVVTRPNSKNYGNSIADVVSFADPNSGNSSRTFIRLRGGRNGLIDEIYKDVLYRAEHDFDKLLTKTYNENGTLFIMEDLTVQTNKTETEFTLMMTPNDHVGQDKETAEKQLNEEIRTGTVHISNGSLLSILQERSLAEERDPISNLNVFKGEFISCDENQACSINLSGLRPSLEAKHCEFFVDKLGKSDGKFSGDDRVVGDVLLALKVRGDLIPQVSALYFKATRMENNGFNPTPAVLAFIPNSSGYYKISFGTNAVQDGPGPVVSKGYFQMDLKDGRSFVIHASTGKEFVVDPLFARNISAVVSQTHVDNGNILEIVNSLPKTATSRDGSAQYINPYNCQ